LYTVTTYEINYPYAGLPHLEVQISPFHGMLKQVENTYTAMPLSGTRSALALTRRVEQTFDLTGTPFPIVTTTNQYDAYGNTTQVVVATDDGYTKKTVNTYQNDT